MSKRFVVVWFRFLKTDWISRHTPALSRLPFVLATPDHGRMVITEVNHFACQQGIEKGMILADARVIIPTLRYFDDTPGLGEKLLKGIAEWCIRFTPIVAIDPPDGLILDATGCAHLWGGEESYLTSIVTRLQKIGYCIHAAMADTIGAAWAITRFGKNKSIIKSGEHLNALLPLPVASLRLNRDVVERLQKLGLREIKDFIAMPRSALRRRLGNDALKKIDHALGREEEVIYPVQPVEPYYERLPCLEPIVSRIGIEIALKQLLELLCKRLQKESKGVRMACFKAYRVDGKIEKIEIGTIRPSYNAAHLFKLFELNISTIEPALGIELFTLESSKVEDHFVTQEKIWKATGGLDDVKLSELMDRLAGKVGMNHIHRYLPDEHYWPERSIKAASSLDEKPSTTWRSDKPRPIELLSTPEPIEVTAPIPDYPPMLFRYKNKLHKVKKADGPERIEPEWWIDEKQHRDYYCVEDEEGHRYWLFRSGHYSAEKNYQWFIHGFFP